MLHHVNKVRLVNEDVKKYIAAQPDGFREVCERLQAEITSHLPEAQNKVWHGSPVWFIDGNPIVGYWARKDNVQLLFWSGQSFDEAALAAEGKFKAAEMRYASTDEIDGDNLLRWCEKARAIQWDYKNIVRNRGILMRVH